MKVLVRGRIHYTKWTDQQGVERYGCEIIAETVDFLSRAKQTQNEDGKFIDDDDIPF
jgi:single-strand DNA-binding protein